jgi:hypothetical protein
MRYRALSILTGLLVFSLLAQAAAAQDTHLIVITGVAGDEEHGTVFHKWATTIIDAARKNDAIPAANIVYLAEKTDRDPARIRDRATKAVVEKTFADLAARVGPNDQLFVVLFGHGSFDGRQAAFNLSGPDLTAADYDRLLSKFGSQRIVFVNTSSSSGAFLEEAFAGDAADRNRDQRVSVFEAFEYARLKVGEAYQRDGILLTEHATLNDGSEGKFATTLFLASDRSRSAALAKIADPELRTLMQERQTLEDRIAALRLRKDQRELERLVTELALKSRAIQQRETKK